MAPPARPQPEREGLCPLARPPRGRGLLVGLLLSASAASTGCGGPALRRFPLREPVWRDGDLDPVTVACSPDPKAPKDRPDHKLCRPAEYESSFAWDGADNLVFRQLTSTFSVEVGGEAVNVNSMDEVPDSSWFTNRIGRTPMTPEQAALGPCPKASLDTAVPDGSWLIDMGKDNGFNPGFRVRVPAEHDARYMLKGDLPDQPERATGATAIATRVYHAAGWFAPCDSVVYARPSLFKLKPGLTVTDNTGLTKPFDEAMLARVLKNASHRGELVRLGASKWLAGRTLGPFTYAGLRRDDPNDAVPHEDRRDLRGAKIIAAWLNHFDSREQNSMSTWHSVDENDPDSSPGVLLHWYLDLGDCFGSEWSWDGISRRLGHAYYFDIGYVAEDFVTLGTIERPWERARKSPEGDIFGYFSARDFDPDKWRGGYPNPAFARATELDAAWAARIIARFSPEHVEAMVKVGNYTERRHQDYLTRTLLARQRIILSRYLARLSPVTDVTVSESGELCGVDLARQVGLGEAASFRYSASAWAGEALAPRPSPSARAGEGAGVCVKLEHFAPDGGAADGSFARYLVVDVRNGWSYFPLRAHLYDLGPSRGFRLVGLERPDSNDPPR